MPANRLPQRGGIEPIKPEEEHAMGEVARQPVRGRERETCLAYATRPQEGDNPRCTALQEPEHERKIIVPSNQWICR